MIFHCVTVIDLSHNFFPCMRIDCWQILQMQSDLNCKIYNLFIYFQRNHEYKLVLFKHYNFQAQ